APNPFHVHLLMRLRREPRPTVEARISRGVMTRKTVEGLLERRHAESRATAHSRVAVLQAAVPERLGNRAVVRTEKRVAAEAEHRKRVRVEICKAPKWSRIRRRRVHRPKIVDQKARPARILIDNHDACDLAS